MGAEDKGGQVSRYKPEEDVRCGVVVVGDKRVGRSNGVEIALVAFAEEVWRGCVENKTV